MSNYIPGGQKKVKIFKKRERELLHALKNDHTEERVTRAVERLRHAKLQAIRIQQMDENRSRDERRAIAIELYERWESYTVEEIIHIYRAQLEGPAA